LTLKKLQVPNYHLVSSRSKKSKHDECFLNDCLVTIWVTNLKQTQTSKKLINDCENKHYDMNSFDANRLNRF